MLRASGIADDACAGEGEAARPGGECGDLRKSVVA